MTEWFCNLNITKSKVNLMMKELLKCTRWLSNCCQLNRSRRLEWNLRGSLWLLVSLKSSQQSFHPFTTKFDSFLDINLLPSHAPNYQPEVLMIDIASTFVNILRVPAALCITCPQMSILTRLQSFPPRPRPTPLKSTPFCRIFPQVGNSRLKPYLICPTHNQHRGAPPP